MRRFAGDEVRQVVVIGGIEAPRRRRRGARARRVTAAEVNPVEVTRATVIDAAPLGELEEADRWLQREVGAERPGASALGCLNRAVAGYRVSAADPWVPDADPSRALAFRVGYGTGEQVAGGEWEAARSLPVPEGRGSRSLVLAPHERLAALLGGRDVALACEELTLRARGDLDHGRTREAALQASIALTAALAELEGWRGDPGMAARLDELAGHRSPVEAAVGVALQGGLDAESLAAIEAALGRLEAALRARAAARD